MSVEPERIGSGEFRMIGRVKEYSSAVVAVSSLVAALIVVLNGIGNALYARQASNYYDIPIIYFTDDSTSTKMLNFISYLLITVTPIIPFFLKYMYISVFTKFYALAYSFLMYFSFLSLVGNLELFVIKSFGLDWLDNAVGVFVACTISLVLTFFYWIVLPHGRSRNVKRKSGCSETEAEKEKGRSYKFYVKRKLFHGILKRHYNKFIVGVLAIPYVLFACVLSMEAIQFPGNLHDYEIVETSPGSYKVIVGYHDEDAILMDFGAVHKNKDSKYSVNCPDFLAKILLKKGNFVIDSVKGKPIRYCNFGRVEIF